MGTIEGGWVAVGRPDVGGGVVIVASTIGLQAPLQALKKVEKKWSTDIQLASRVYRNLILCMTGLHP